MQKRARLLIMSLTIFCTCSCNAQDIRFNEPPQVSEMVGAWVRYNRTNPGLSGWRVQLVSSTDRVKVEEGKARFLQLYPDVPADWVHEKPYYKLRAGAFHTRLEAAAFVQTLRNDYPGAYPAQDRNIHPRDFLSF